MTFQKADPAFPMRDNEVELPVLTGGLPSLTYFPTKGISILLKVLLHWPLLPPRGRAYEKTSLFRTSGKLRLSSYLTMPFVFAHLPHWK